MHSTELSSSFSRVRDFISKRTGIRQDLLSEDSRLLEDLKIDADDAFELLKDFSKEFSVDMKNFPVDEYLAPEGVDLVGALRRILSRHGRKRLRPLTLIALTRAAIQGAWIEP